MMMRQKGQPKSRMLFALIAFLLVACQRAEPVDLLEGQRPALEKAKALETQIQQQAERQRQALEAQMQPGNEANPRSVSP